MDTEARTKEYNRIVDLLADAPLDPSAASANNNEVCHFLRELMAQIDQHEQQSIRATPKMKLFMLARPNGAGYEEYEGFIMRAETEQHARELACRQATPHWREEFDQSFMSRDYATCSEVSVDGDSVILLSSFHHG